MVAIKTDILLGSVENLPQQSFTLSSGGATLALGDYYLRHTTTSLSLIDAVASAMDAAGASNTSIVIRRDRKVKITFDSAEAITWGSATQLRNLLGYDGDSGSSTSHVAANISPLLWSPSYRGLYSTIEGVDGYDVDDTILTKSQTGQTIVATNHYTAVRQRLSWDAVPIARVHTTSEAGGEYKKFRDQVLKDALRFVVVQDSTEDSSSTSNMTWGTQFGPYKPDNVEQFNDWYRRKVNNADIWSPIDIEIIKVAEYS